MNTFQATLSGVPTRLHELNAAKFNPREITVKNMNRLKASLEDFGDISGIVFNRTTGELVSGHQRVFALIQAYGDLQLISTGNNSGYVHVPNGKRFTVRFVDWAEPDQLAAAIAANSPTLQGTFTNEIQKALSSLAASLPNVYEALGFDELKPFEPLINFDRSNAEEHSPCKEAELSMSIQDSNTVSDKAHREGKLVTKEIANDVKLEARFDLRVPEAFAREATVRLLDLVGQWAGATVQRID